MFLPQILFLKKHLCHKIFLQTSFSHYFHYVYSHYCCRDSKWPCEGPSFTSGWNDHTASSHSYWNKTGWGSVDQTLSNWLGIQFRQRYGPIKDRRPIFFWIFLACHDPETRGVQKLILSLFKIPSLLTYGWKSVRFWGYFHTFHENGEEVLLMIRLKTTTKTILEAVLFIYLLKNINIVGI